MKISSLGLSAFLQTARDLNVTRAAFALGLTQSALSQRLSSLEQDLEVTLFIREPRGLRLTPAGEKLLRFVSIQSQMEDELIYEIKGNQTEIGGHFRIASYSSILRSVIVPALAPLMRKNLGVKIDFQSHEMNELPGVLQSSNADIIIMDYQLKKSGILEHYLGDEEFVVIENQKQPGPTDLYLDHGPLDNATEDFFKAQARAPKVIRRAYVGDVYGIIDGVELGLGRAVMSRHLIQNNKQLRTIAGYQKYKRPVTIHHPDQPYFSRLHNLILQELLAQGPKFLK